MSRPSTFCKTERRYLLEINLFLSVFLLSIGGFGGEILQIFSYALFGLTPSQIGFMIGGLALWLPLPFLGAVAVEKLGAATILAFGFVTRAALISLLALLPYLVPLGNAEFYWLLLALIWCLGANHSATFTSAWPAVVRSVTADGDRARFISFMRLILLASVIGALLLLGQLAKVGIRREHFAILCAAIAVSALWSVRRVLQLRALCPDLQRRDDGTGGVSSIALALKACLAHKPLINLAALALIIQLCKAPLLPVALMKQLAFDAEGAFWISAVQQGALGVSLGLGALWLDKQGYVIVLRQALALSCLAALGLFLLLSYAGYLERQTIFASALLITFALGVGAGLALLALDIASFDAAPIGWTAPGLALYGMIFSSADAFAQWIGGALLDVSFDGNPNYYAAFVLAGGMIMAALASRLHFSRAASLPAARRE